MKAFIDRDNCISCGLCAGTCPDVFLMAQDDKALVYIDEVPSDAEVTSLQAQENCPVSVITLR